MPRWMTLNKARRATQLEFVKWLADAHTFHKVGKYWYRTLS